MFGLGLDRVTGTTDDNGPMSKIPNLKCKPIEMLVVVYISHEKLDFHPSFGFGGAPNSKGRIPKVANDGEAHASGLKYEEMLHVSKSEGV